jgi:transcriptional regulator with XRE-family HTH domain
VDATSKPLSEWLAPYNRSAVARELGVDTSTVSRWYRGKAIPQGDQLQALARFLGIDANAIIIKRAAAAV